MLRSSAQITAKYEPDDLVDRQILAVVNLGSRQIGSVISQCLVLGLHDDDDDVVLVHNGRRTGARWQSSVLRGVGASSNSTEFDISATAVESETRLQQCC